MASWTISTLFLVALFSLLYNDLMGQTHEYSVSLSTNLFAHEIMYNIVNQNPTENVVCSPFSINHILALLYMGAKSKTENELQTTLKINTTKKDFGWKYNKFLEIIFKKNQTKGAPKLEMANRLYISSEFKVKDKFRKIAQSVNFGDPFTVNAINEWVKQKTKNKINNFLQPNSVDIYTNSILVNAIYFKGTWLSAFPKVGTRQNDFYVSPSQTVQVDTMFQINRFGYVELPDLNARALEMPYQNSDISLLVILPNDIYGLQKLEESLQGKNLNEIISKMQPEIVSVLLPKFRIEYEIDLKEPLRKMGISSMFDENANLSGIYESGSQIISDVKQKTFLEWNEEHTEASAATAISMFNRAFGPEPTANFHANHPFFFAIRSSTTVFFAGHVVKP